MVLYNFVLYLTEFGRTKATADHLILKGREEYVRFAFPICPQDDGTCSHASPEQGSTIPMNSYQNHLAALQDCDGEWHFGSPCLWMPVLPLWFLPQPLSLCPCVPLGPAVLRDVTSCSAPACPALAPAGLASSHWASPKVLPQLSKAGGWSIVPPAPWKYWFAEPQLALHKVLFPWASLRCRSCQVVGRGRHWNKGKFLGVLVWGLYSFFVIIFCSWAKCEFCLLFGALNTSVQ